MARNDKTSVIIDGLLKILLTGGTIGAVVIAPNSLSAIHKPLFTALDKLDKRSRDRELRRITLYMRRQGLLTGDYEHGLTITHAGMKRATQADFDNLTIARPEKWDKQWRLVIFDIPERLRNGRVALTQKLRLLGFQPLQQSVWIHPFPCRSEITTVCLTFDVSKYVTYIETTHIDHEKFLQQRFKHILK